MKRIFLLAATVACMASCQNNQPKTPAIDLSNFDLSVAPNADFYQYATGGWQKNNPLKPEFSRYGSFDVLRENNEKRINALFQEMTKLEAAPGSVEQKISDLYKMGLDSVRLNAEGAAPLAADLRDPALKVPHIGWNALDIVPGRADDPLFRYVKNGEYVYYVHSYYAKHCADSTLATSDYSLPVTGAVRRGLVYGTQFHPEKSGDTGLRLLRAFAEL